MQQQQPPFFVILNAIESKRKEIFRSCSLADDANGGGGRWPFIFVSEIIIYYSLALWSNLLLLMSIRYDIVCDTQWSGEIKNEMIRSSECDFRLWFHHCYYCCCCVFFFYFNTKSDDRNRRRHFFFFVFNLRIDRRRWRRRQQHKHTHSRASPFHATAMTKNDNLIAFDVDVHWAVESRHTFILWW